MKKITLAVLLLSALAMAGTSHSPGEYPLTVHVTASRMVVHQGYYQQLSVLIDGKQYELQSEVMNLSLLKMGDYKARLVEDKHRTEYDTWQVYEFLFPDNKTRRYVVMEMKP